MEDKDYNIDKINNDFNLNLNNGSYKYITQSTSINPASTPIYLEYKAYKRMAGYAIRYANNNIDQDKWREVYGILIGSIREDNIIIKDAVPVCVGGRIEVELEPIHYVDLSQIDSSLYEKYIEDQSKDFIIGWWHSHPGLDFFFSKTDCETHLGYQDINPYAVGLIFDHTKLNSEGLGVAALRLKNPKSGMFSKYKFVKLFFNQEKESIKKDIIKLLSMIKDSFDKVLKEIQYIDNELRQKRLKVLENDFGLSLIPKDNGKILHHDEKIDAKEELKDQYIWNIEYVEKSFEIPKFRKKFETDLMKAITDLRKLSNTDAISKYNEKLNKARTKLKVILKKPTQLYEKLIDEYKKRIKFIYPYYDFLDTEERKIIEKFDEDLSNYYEILEILNKKAELNI